MNRLSSRSTLILLKLKSVLLTLIFLGVPSLSYAQQSGLDRGRYLVDAVMACDGCHTPRGPNGLIMKNRFSGGPQIWETSEYLVRGSNITPDNATGIGEWSAGDIKRSLIDGIRPDNARLPGTPLSPQMPFAFYKIMTPADLDAVVAYVRSVAPIPNEVPGPTYKAPMHAELIPNGEKPMDERAMADPVSRGFYLATIAHCMECHAKGPDGALNFKTGHGKGGYEMKGPFGSVVVSNITSHPTKGIGAWTDAEIKKALTHGVGRDGRAFKLPMARQAYYSQLTAQDLDALVAWVRTLPSLE